MTLEVYRATWYAEIGLCDFDGRGYWHGTTSSAPCDSEEQARGVLLSLDGISEDPKKPGEFLNSFPMGLARIRKELVLDEAETSRIKKTREALGQCRLAFAGYVSVQSAVDMLDNLGAK